MLPTPGADTARQSLAHIARLGETPRFWRLQAHEALWMGSAYDHRKSFWDQSVPLRERAPVVQSQIVKACGRRLVTMTVGKRAFPTASVAQRAYGVTFSESEAATLTELVAEILTAAKLKRVLREYLAEGLKCGSACAVLSLQEGVPTVDIIPAKWCTPTLARDGSVKRLVIEYRYPMTADADETRLMVYRREIGGGFDTVYAPWRADDEHAKVIVASRRALSFVPVVWTRNLTSSVEKSLDVDGSPLIDGMEDEVEALDLTLSMRVRNGYYNGDPQMVQIVGTTDAPLGAQGPVAVEPPRSGFSRLGDALGRFFGGGSTTATKKGPGQVWKIAAPGDAKLLESSGAGATILDGVVNELRRVILDAVGVVMADPETMGKGDLSARALSMLHAPMLDVVSCLAEDYGAALATMLSMFARMIVSPEGEQGVHLLSAEAAAPLLQRLWREVEVPGSQPPALALKWVPLPVALEWGDSFEPSWADVSAAVESATKGVESRVMSRRAAVTMLAPVRGGDANVDHELDAIEADDAASHDAVRATLGSLDESTPATPTEPTQAADATAPTGIDPSNVKDQATALNGAQVAAAQGIAIAVASGQLAPEQAVALLTMAFPISAEVARAIAGNGPAPKPIAPTSPQPPFGAAPAAPP